MQLTLKAMETGTLIHFSLKKDASDENVKTINEKNSQFVRDFYKAMLEAVSSANAEQS